MKTPPLKMANNRRRRPTWEQLEQTSKRATTTDDTETTPVLDALRDMTQQLNRMNCLHETTASSDDAAISADQASTSGESDSTSSQSPPTSKTAEPVTTGCTQAHHDRLEEVANQVLHLRNTVNQREENRQKALSKRRSRKPKGHLTPPDTEASNSLADAIGNPGSPNADGKRSTATEARTETHDDCSTSMTLTDADRSWLCVHFYNTVQAGLTPMPGQMLTQRQMEEVITPMVRDDDQGLTKRQQKLQRSIRHTIWQHLCRLRLQQTHDLPLSVGTSRNKTNDTETSAGRAVFYISKEEPDDTTTPPPAEFVDTEPMQEPDRTTTPKVVETEL